MLITTGVRIKISLECVVRRQPGVNDSFEENLGRGDPDMAQGNDWFSRYHTTKLFNQQYNPIYTTTTLAAAPTPSTVSLTHQLGHGFTL